jgi:hypothetical protein
MGVKKQNVGRPKYSTDYSIAKTLNIFEIRNQECWVLGKSGASKKLNRLQPRTKRKQRTRPICAPEFPII